MNTKMKNIFKISTIALSIVGCQLAFAGPTDMPYEINMLKALNNLNTNVQVVGNRLQSAAEANAKSQHDAVNSAGVSDSEVGNLAYQKAKNANDKNTLDLTLNDIQGQLQPLSDNLLETQSGMINSDAISNRLIADINRKRNLSIDLPGSDSPYSNDPSVLPLANLYPGIFPKWGLSKPTVDNNNFSFSSIIGPIAYDPKTDQQSEAQNALTFLTKSYTNPSDDIDFSKFQDKLQDSKNPQDKVGLYMQLVKDPKYQDYLLNSRAATTQRSVAINNFQSLVSERTPVKGLGKNAGMPDTEDASPLQVQQYIATRRVSSPKWFTHVASASPTSVQRETLVVLSEIEAQNFQAHLDRERLIATLSAQAAMSGSMANNMAAAKARDLSQDFQNYTLQSAQQTDDKNSKDNPKK